MAMASEQKNDHKTLFIAIFIGTVIVLNFFPHMILAPGHDSGIFLYHGQRILEGDLPYRDIWDHKPPMIFYINALGLFISGGAKWGVLFLEILAVGAAMALCFALLKKRFGYLPAFFATLNCVLCLNIVLDGGNLTEEFNLPLQFLGFWLFNCVEKKGFRVWHGIFLGLSMASSFMLRQNLIGLWLAILLYWFLEFAIYQRDLTAFSKRVFWIFSGAAALLLPAGMFFYFQGALYELWDVAFRYNFIYSKTTLAQRIQSFYGCFKLFTWFPLVIMPAAIIVCGYFKRKEKITADPLMTLAIADLVIEITLLSLGKGYAHYYTAMLPSMTLLFCFFIKLLNDSAWDECDKSNMPGHSGFSGKTERIIVLSILLACSNIFSFSILAHSYAGLLSRHRSQLEETADYIKRNSGKNDYLLVWGSGGQLNFLTGRPSPSRFFFQYPFAATGYGSPEIINSFMKELRRHPPAIIIDNSGDTGRLPPIDKAYRKQWKEKKASSNELYSTIPANIDSFYNFVETEYNTSGKSGSWNIYKHNKNGDISE